MAKLKAPLLSLGASGAIGKALVFFNWKGLDVVREYVIPSNPQTKPQTDQRDLLTAAVKAIHDAQALAVGPLDSTDISAYGLWAVRVKAATTWFNQVVRNWLDVSIDGKTPSIYRSGVTAPGVKLLHPSLLSDEINGTDITAGHFFYGTSPSALVNSIEATITEPIHQASVEIPNLSAGRKYYVQFRPDATENCQGAWSGIYHGTPTAA